MFGGSKCPTCKVKLEFKPLNSKNLLVAAVHAIAIAADYKYKWGVKKAAKSVVGRKMVHECPVCGFQRFR